MYEECFNKGDLSMVDDVISENFVSRTPNPGGLPPDREGFKQTVNLLRSGFPDLNMTVDGMVAEGDTVAARVTARGTHTNEFMGIPPTGKQVTMTGMDFVRFENGKVVERWGAWDQLGMMQQLGVIPAEAPAGA
jgi:steroid delta-isomerase-like uncharacterized protein